jgi:tRNA threonylcarbamoyladenosine biosynthesis protein TsaB
VEKEPLILSLETSTDACSVAISKGEKCLAFRAADEAFRHSEWLTTLVQQCVDEVGLPLQKMDAVAVSSGPGSYTSLRVGTSTAKGICYALGLPLISVDTLQALALAAFNEYKLADALYCPMIDARRMEVYCAVYTGQNKMVAEPRAIVVEADSFQDYFGTGKRVIFTGDGAEKCREILPSKQAEFYPLSCSASHLPVLAAKKYAAGEFEEIAYYVPSYLKPPNITKPKNMSMLHRLKG